MDKRSGVQNGRLMWRKLVESIGIALVPLAKRHHYTPVTRVWLNIRFGDSFLAHGRSLGRLSQLVRQIVAFGQSICLEEPASLNAVAAGAVCYAQPSPLPSHTTGCRIVSATRSSGPWCGIAAAHTDHCSVCGFRPCLSAAACWIACAGSQRAPRGSFVDPLQRRFFWASHDEDALGSGPGSRSGIS